MKNILFISLLIFIACTTQEENAQQQMFDDSEKSDTLVIEVEEPKVTFRMALDSLVNLKYQYEVKEFREIPIDSASVIYRVNRTIGWANRDSEELIDSVPINDLKTVQYAFLKGKQSMRTVIEEWNFSNKEAPKIVVDYLEYYEKEDFNGAYLHISSKSPFEYFQLENKLYIINTAGNYMYGEDRVLKVALMTYLK